MNYKAKPYHRNVPDKVLLTNLRKTAKRLGKKNVSSEEYRKEGNYDSTTLIRRFGSWNAALVKAGLEVKKISRVGEDELLQNLKIVWDALGRQPLLSEMRSPLSRHAPSTYVRRYGSWHNSLIALEKAVKNGELKSDKEQRYIKNKGSRFIKGDVKNFIKNFHVNKSMRFDVMLRDDFKCKACGASPATDPKVKLHVDHIIPASKGGKAVLSNLQTLCSDCNQGKGAKEVKRQK